MCRDKWYEIDQGINLCLQLGGGTSSPSAMEAFDKWIMRIKYEECKIIFAHAVFEKLAEGLCGIRR